MLINFTFGNYKSIKEEQQFTMERQDEPSYDVSGWVLPRVSPVAAIYGPNASGKSNVLTALQYVSRLVERSFRSGDMGSGLEAHPHALDPSYAQGESAFLVEFIASDGLRYVYWFTCTSSRIEYERLDVYRSKQPSNLFRRSHEAGGVKVEFGPSFKGPKAQMEKLTRPNSLFLSVAAACGSEAVGPAHAFLTDGIRFYDAPAYESETPRILALVDRQAPRGRQLGELVRYADFGIEEMGRREREVGEREDRLLRTVMAGIADDVPDDVVEEVVASRRKELTFLHRGAGGSFWLGQSDESDGTIAALSFFNVVLDALTEGGVVLVDEIEKSLHPVIVRELVDLFCDPATNPLQAQLIFTTHDTSLINESGSVSKLLQRDQVWLVEKDSNGATSVLPLTAFHVRPGDNYGRNYLNGVYGATPTPSLHSHVAEIVAAALEEGGGAE